MVRVHSAYHFKFQLHFLPVISYLCWRYSSRRARFVI
jgi:hypothetical protein